MAGTLTGANSIITLTIANLYASPQQLKGFAADDIFDVDTIETVETLMGVDGILSGGFVYVARKQTFSMQANSNSCAIFDAWNEAQSSAQDVYTADGITTLKSIGTSYTMTNGFLTSYSPIPSVGKLIKPRKFTITWQIAVRGSSN